MGCILFLVSIDRDSDYSISSGKSILSLYGDYVGTYYIFQF